MQADTAVDAVKLKNIVSVQPPQPVRPTFWSSRRLSAANASYKLLDRFGGRRRDRSGAARNGQAGPHPADVGCSLQDVLNLATVASVDWQAQSEQI
jgi:hypothetical protein